ncbi:unnamed protein product [Spirodela intermedia]|uniref:F-box domain-containing protein n=1 Tax=Spirodela intermedia TaxID=51605 RepID=A0ABN7EBD0_SPIIN|nr:unnamed protein product [Spirodela intermedia]
MGAGASSILWPDGEECNAPGLGDLPEACVASVLMHLDPPEICRLARLNRAFQGAASADFVWESKLPNNYGYLLEKIASEEEAEQKNRAGGKRLGKKEIYAMLCRPNPFDGGNKIFWLNKYKGGICMPISSKALYITGIDDRRYWNHIPTDESRFHTVAYLQQTWWFEVDGEIEFCFPPGTYSLFFRLHLGGPHVHGGKSSQYSSSWPPQPGWEPRGSASWRNLGAGPLRGRDFVVESSAVPTRIKFSMMQIDCTHTKGGLCVDSAVIYPHGVRPERVSVDSRFKTL